MNCPKCERHNPDDAQFCIYCAARIAPEPPVVQTAATGPTTRLDPQQAPFYTMPGTPAQSAPPVAAPARSSRHNKPATGPVWLIGLGILFLTGNFWPGILVLVGVTSFINESGRGRHQKAARSLIFFIGLAVLFWTNWFWPGILILIGLTTLLSPRRRHGWC